MLSGARMALWKSARQKTRRRTMSRFLKLLKSDFECGHAYVSSNMAAWLVVFLRARRSGVLVHYTPAVLFEIIVAFGRGYWRFAFAQEARMVGLLELSSRGREGDDE